jgi:hypothetical protein
MPFNSESSLLIGECDNMEFAHCSLVNASPVNNGSGAIYQTTMTGPNGQPTELFSSGMQYPRKTRTLLVGKADLIDLSFLLLDCSRSSH